MDHSPSPPPLPMSADLESFERAIIVSFQVLQSQHTIQLANKAAQYCAEVEASPLGWRLTLEVLRITTKSEVKFFCLQALQRLLLNESDRYAKLSQEDKVQLRSVFMHWIRDTSLAATTSQQQEERYIRSKVGVVLALLAKQQYPSLWPSCFDDMLDLLRHNSTSSGAAVMAERLVYMLEALDEEVVSQHGNESMAIKDEMRKGVIMRLMPALGDICRAFADANADLVRRCWNVIGLYAGWVDIALTTEESFLRVWFAHCLDVRYHANALGALNKLVQKGMDPDSKLNLISQLGLVDCCLDMCCPNAYATSSTSSNNSNNIWLTFKQQQPPPSPRHDVNNGIVAIGGGGEGGENNFELEAAKFCAALGTEILFCRKAMAEGAAQRLRALMDRVLFCLFALLGRVDRFDLQAELLEFANKIVMSNQPSGGGGEGVVDFFGPDMVRSMFLAILSCVRIPLSHNLHEVLATSSSGGAGNEEELGEEEDFREHRSNVKRLFLNLVRCAGAIQVLPLLQPLLQQVVHLQQNVFAVQRDVEAILYLVYTFGEAAPEISTNLKKNAAASANDPAVQALITNFDLLLVSIFQSPLFAADAPPSSAVVAVMYNELATRYIVNMRTQACLPVIVQRVCGLGGIHHSTFAVRSKAAGLLLRIVRALEQYCAPLCVPIFSALQDVINTGLDFDICCRESKQQQMHKSAPAGGREILLSSADALLVFEAVGYMVGNPSLWPEEHTRRAYFTHVIQTTLDATLRRACLALDNGGAGVVGAGAGGNRRRSAEELELWGTCQLEALASVCKGFALQTEEAIVALWRDVLRTALIATVRFLQTPASGAGNKAVADDLLLNALRRLCHGLIRTMGNEILVFFPDICQCLLETPNADVCRALPLLNQMMSAFRGKMYDKLAQNLIPILRATNGRIAPIANLPHHNANDRDDFIAMEKELFTFLFTLASNDLSAVLYHEQNIAHLGEVLTMVVDGLRSVPDASVQKVCVLTLLALCREWLAPSPLPESLRQDYYKFTLEVITPASFQATVQPHFDYKDAACAQLLQQICLLHLTLYDLLGHKWLEYLSTVFLPSACSMDVVQEYCAALQQCKNAPKELRSKFQRLFLGAPPN